MRRWSRVVVAAAPILVSVVVFVPAAHADTPCPIIDPTCLLGDVGQTVGNVGQTVGQTTGSVGQTVGQTVGQIAGSIGATVGALGNTIGSTTKTVGDTIGQLTNGSKAPGGGGPGGGDQGGAGPGPVGGDPGSHGSAGLPHSGIGSVVGGSRAVQLSAIHQHRGRVAGASVVVSTSAGPVYRLQRSASEPGDSLFRRILPEAVSLIALAILSGLALAFLMVQDRIDRRDPKLAPIGMGSDRVRFG